MTEFVRVCALADVPAEGAIGVDIGDVPVAVVRADGEVFALHDVCSHEEVPLSEGDVYDHTVECWLHGSCFDLRTGKPTGPPATKPVPDLPGEDRGRRRLRRAQCRRPRGRQPRGPTTSPAELIQETFSWQLWRSATCTSA